MAINPLPNYEDVYFERDIDVYALISKERWLLAMHIGGIAVECLLCGIIAQYYGVTEYRRKGSQMDWIITQNGEESSITISAHDIIRLFLATKETLELVPVGMLDDIKLLQVPYQRERYIALRYCDYDIEEDHFNKWKESYTKVTNWFAKHLRV